MLGEGRLTRGALPGPNPHRGARASLTQSLEIVSVMGPQPTSQAARRILLLTGQAETQAMRSLLAEAGHTAVSPTAEHAAESLSKQTFDLVVGPPDEIIALARMVDRQKLQSVLEHFPQAVCVVDRSGVILWANPKLRSYPEVVIEAIRGACAQQVALFPREARGDRVRRQSLSVGREFHFEITVSPHVEEGGVVESVVGLAWDISSMRRLQERINAIDAAGRELCELDIDAVREMDVQGRLNLLEQKIIRYSHDLLHFDHFAIRVLEQHSNRLDTVLAAGFSEEAKDLAIFASTEGNGITGFVAATGRSYICPDVQKDPRYLPGVEDARSTLTTPLKLHDQVIGVLNVESKEVAAFTEDDRQTVEIFARYIAMALHILQLLVVERHSTTGQIAADVDAEMARPLNDILSDVSNLMAEYPNDERLRARLSDIIRDVDRVKTAIHSVTEPVGVSGLAPEGVVIDPLIAGKRILVADDEDIIRETVADVLTKQGAKCQMAADGNEAVALIRAQSFDLILSDIKMPNRNGYDVFAAAREKAPDCPVILITGFGYDPNHSIVRASKEGLTGVLFKPFKIEQLLDEVRQALAPRAG